MWNFGNADMSKDKPPKKLKGGDPPKEFEGDQEQFMRFVGAAREVGATEDEDVFGRALKKVAKAPPPDTVQDRKKPKKPAK